MPELLGLSERVHLKQGDATRLDRFATPSFDADWSIHVAEGRLAPTVVYARKK